MTDPITEGDLAGFVDGQLDPGRRLEVEAHLAAHPEAAARVMAELRDRDALRACFDPPPGPGPGRNLALARRLDRDLRWARAGARLRRAAAVAVLVGAGWLAHDEGGGFGVPDTLAATPDPALIEDARQARAVARLRRALTDPAPGRAGVGSPGYDRARLRAATGIDLPALPAGWRARDVEVFPGRHGAGIEVALDAGALGEAALFATRGGRAGPAALTQAGEGTGDGADDGAVLSWTAGGTAYALSGARDGAALREAAGLLGAAAP